MATRRFLSRYQRGSVLVIAIALLVAGLFALQQTWWAVSAAGSSRPTRSR